MRFEIFSGVEQTEPLCGLRVQRTSTIAHAAKYITQDFPFLNTPPESGSIWIARW